MIKEVLITKHAGKQLKKIPVYIVNSLLTWIDNVENIGLDATKKIPGYHDEPLKGRRKGQRSIRLSISYRMIYRIVERERKNKTVELASIEEVTKHKY